MIQRAESPHFLPCLREHFCQDVTVASRTMQIGRYQLLTYANTDRNRGTVMAMTQDVTEADVRFRPPPGSSVLLLAVGVVVAADSGFATPYRLPEALLAVVLVAAALWMSTFGVVLTPEFVRVVGVRRRVISWAQVQAVEMVARYGEHQVKLVLADGTDVRLRAPSTVLGGRHAARFNQDFHTIEQWWLNHRGPDWAPASVHAPGGDTVAGLTALG
jgi:hypothetical protein